ncbi:MAG: CRISPR-associated endonuclease Cas2 [bacterium]|nr:CRISPR-associated endonuclease Cas2 [bacterium]
MGQIEEKSRKRRKKENIQQAVLAAIGIAGILAVTMIAPNIFQAVPGLMGRKRYKLAFQARTASSRLAIKGYVRFILKNGKKWIEITDAGRRALLLEHEKARLDVIQGKRWDKRYRLVMFDIPQKRKNTRDSVRRLLRECGFLRLQDSVWVFPYDCEELIVLIKSDMRLGKDLLYVIVDSIENDGWIKKHFGLG